MKNKPNKTVPVKGAAKKSKTTVKRKPKHVENTPLISAEAADADFKMPSLYPDISNRFKEWRERSGLSFREIGLIMQIPHSTLQTYTTGRTTPNFYVLRYLKHKFGVPYEWIIDGDGPAKSFKEKEGLTDAELNAAVIKLEEALAFLKKQKKK